MSDDFNPPFTPTTLFVDDVGGGGGGGLGDEPSAADEQPDVDAAMVVSLSQPPSHACLLSRRVCVYRMSLPLSSPWRICSGCSTVASH
jgi:hypothetical protein